jgi:hypothetical protein
MRVFTVFYDYKNDDTKINWNEDFFENAYGITKLDVLGDIRGMVEKKYSEIYEIEYPEIFNSRTGNTK